MCSLLLLNYVSSFQSSFYIGIQEIEKVSKSKGCFYALQAAVSCWFGVWSWRRPQLQFYKNLENLVGFWPSTPSLIDLASEVEPCENAKVCFLGSCKAKMIAQVTHGWNWMDHRFTVFSVSPVYPQPFVGTSLSLKLHIVRRKNMKKKSRVKNTSCLLNRSIDSCGDEWSTPISLWFWRAWSPVSWRTFSLECFLLDSFPKHSQPQLVRFWRCKANWWPWFFGNIFRTKIRCAENMLCFLEVVSRPWFTEENPWHQKHITRWHVKYVYCRMATHLIIWQEPLCFTTVAYTMGYTVLVWTWLGGTGQL